MMTKNITYSDLEWLLTELGFSAGGTTGHHQLFESLGFESVILLPQRHPDESVDAAHIVAVRKNLTEKGIIDDKTFDAMLETHAKVNGHPVLLPERS